MRLLDNKLAQGNPAAPERIDAQTSLHFLRREEWFRTGRLFSMDHQTLYGGLHGKPANRQGAQLHPPAGRFFQSAY